jgi:23S rRNA pseudouridine955/2504/2580 synthase
MKDLHNVSNVKVSDGEAGQRIDNFLIRLCKGVPRSHVYRILRSGEVRVNSRRVAATYRLCADDVLRIPPIRMSLPKVRSAAPSEFPVVFEDDNLLVIDKPAGKAVHGGSGISFGVIESLRAARTGVSMLELVHRLDRDTSGLLIIAKSRATLTDLHAQMREAKIFKRYLVLVLGEWHAGKKTVSMPLRKFLSGGGERRVVVDRQDGVTAITEFEPAMKFKGYTLLSARLRTGRTHQIRVHLSHLGFPIAGDDKYGIFDRNRSLAKQGLSRLFLHAAELKFLHPASGENLRFECALPIDLQRFLDGLEK